MAKVTITAPNRDYNGVSAGVRFTDGIAVIDSEKQLAALEYFSRHRFGVSEDVPAATDKTEGKAPAVKVEKQNVPLDPTDAEKVAKLTKDEIEALFTQHEVTLVAGTKAEMAAALAAGIVAKAQTPPVNSGAVGPTHNTGHDGANPDGDEPQQTPADAGI